MRKKTIVTTVLAMLFVAGAVYVAYQVIAATDDFTANADITVEAVTYLSGSGSADMLIMSGSTAESFSYDSGAFSVTNPGTFTVGSSDSDVDTLVVRVGTVNMNCAENTTPGTSAVSVPTAANTYNVVPSTTDDCADYCPTTTGAATYNDFPTCGAATCQTGYTLSGSGAGGTCTANGGGGGGTPSGGGGGAGSPAQTTTTTTTQAPTTTSYSSGSLLRESGSNKVYLLEGTQKRWVPDAETFTANGYAWNNIKVVDSSVMAQYSEGSSVAKSASVSEGSLIKYTGDSKVYVLESGKKRWIPDATTFTKLGYSWNKIVTVAGSQTYADGDKKSTSEKTTTTVSTPASAATGAFTKNLSKGTKHSEVKLLQDKLKALGYLATDVDSTGYYGNLTVEAVKKFQKANGISAVGYVGPATRSKLNSL